MGQGGIEDGMQGEMWDGHGMGGHMVGHEVGMHDGTQDRHGQVSQDRIWVGPAGAPHAVPFVSPRRWCP